MRIKVAARRRVRYTRRLMKHAWTILAACLSALLAVPVRAADAPPAGAPVFVIPIRGPIEPALEYVVRRGLAEAQREQAGAVIFVMDTPGGRVDSATSIIRLIGQVQVPTYTFVEKDAFSAGALIALATDHIYMAPGSVIGAATPMMMSPIGGGPQELPPAIEEKTVSAVAALARAAAESGGHDPQLAEKMVRREGEYRIGEDVIAATNHLLTLTNIEAEKLVHRDEGAPGPVLSAGTVADLDALLARLSLSGAPRRELKVTQAERLARYVADPTLATIFLLLGLLGIYVEIKTPGFGLPGILGGLSLALFFWGHHIAGLAGFEEIALFVLGAALLIAELLFFPTAGFLAIAGGGLMLFALLLAMVQNFPGGPWLPPASDLRGPLVRLAITILLAVPLAMLFYRFLPHTPAFSRIALDRATRREDGFTAVPVPVERIGQAGTAASALRPSGTGQFGDERLDVMTRGSYVAAGRAIRIVAVEAGTLIVEEEPA